MSHERSDITPQALAPPSGKEIGEVRVSFTDRIGNLALNVADERGAALTDYVALAFPAEKERSSRSWRRTRCACRWGERETRRLQLRRVVLP